MSNNPLPYDSTVIASVNTVCALLNSGFLAIYTGPQPALNGSLTGTLLASLGFSATAFPAATAAGGIVTATANPVSSAIAANSGTAGYFALLKIRRRHRRRDRELSGMSGSDLNLSALSVAAGQTVSCSSFAITEAES